MTMEWSERFSVHNRDLDADHEKILRYIQLLEDTSFREITSRSFLAEMIENLTQYTRTHFAAEERMMQRFEYPHFSEHAAEHRRFEKDLEAFRCDFDKDRPDLDNALAHYLKNWFIGHILSHDKRYDEYFVEKGIRTDHQAEGQVSPS